MLRKARGSTARRTIEPTGGSIEPRGLELTMLPSSRAKHRGTLDRSAYSSRPIFRKSSECSPSRRKKTGGEPIGAEIA